MTGKSCPVSTRIRIDLASSSAFLKHRWASMFLSTFHWISMGLSCGVYLGRYIKTMSPPADSTYSDTLTALCAERLSRNMTNFLYICRISLRNSMKVSAFMLSTTFTWTASGPTAPMILVSYALRSHSVLGVILHGAAFFCAYAGTGPECIPCLLGGESDADLAPVGFEPPAVPAAGSQPHACLVLCQHCVILC